MFDWSGEEYVRDHVRCRVFRPLFACEPSSAALYEPAGRNAAFQAPVMLMQHGGSSTKLGLDIWDAAMALVGFGDCRLLAIDGPVHGARAYPLDPADGSSVRARFFKLWGSEPDHVMTHVQRWQALIDEIQAALPGAPCMWLGLSMGAAYGMPLLSVDKRISRAVLGMWGTSFVNSERLAMDAKGIQIPVLFQQKWDDELFTREGQLELFDAVGSRDKRLHVYPGGHTRLGAEQMEDLVRFLMRESAS